MEGFVIVAQMCEKNCVCSQFQSLAILLGMREVLNAATRGVVIRYRYLLPWPSRVMLD
jgi:hypothetical protein